jgi:hypothetical protein
MSVTVLYSYLIIGRYLWDDATLIDSMMDEGGDQDSFASQQTVRSGELGLG